MKAKFVLYLLVALFATQTVFASYSNADSSKTLILKHKKRDMVAKLEVGNKTFIQLKDDNKKIKGTVSKIEEKSISIDGTSYKFEDIKAIGAKRKQKSYKLLNGGLTAIGTTALIFLSLIVALLLIVFFITAIVTVIYVIYLIATFKFPPSWRKNKTDGLKLALISIFSAGTLASLIAVREIFLNKFFIRKNKLKNWDLKVVDSKMAKYHL